MVEENRRFVYADFGSSTSSVSNIKDKNRSIYNLIRKERRESSIQTKRFRTGDNEEALNAENFSVANTKLVAKTFQKKTGKVQEELKYLRNSFAQSIDFIEAFLEVDNALYSLVGYLTGSDTTLQLEAAWCITNIAANDYKDISAVVKATSAYLVTFLRSGSVLLQDQSAWALGNMAADNEAVRETLKSQGIVGPLIDLVKSDVDGVVQSALFALCNLSKSQMIFVPELLASDLLNVVERKLNNPNIDLNIIGEIAWLLTYFTYNEHSCFQLVDQGFLRYIVGWICKVRPHQQEYLFIVTPMSRCLGNILGCEERNYIQNIPESSMKLLMSTLNTFLSSGKRFLIKECLWLIGNLFAQDLSVALKEGTCDDNDISLILPNIVNHLNSAYEIRREAAVCICNLSCQKNSCYFASCCSENAVKSFLDFFKVHDADLIWLAMSFFEQYLQRRNKNRNGHDTDYFLEGNGPSYLEAFEYHENEDIRQKAVYLLERFYENEDGLIDAES